MKQDIGIILLALGLLLLIYMITVEGEPGALPLALCFLGAIILIWKRKKENPQ